MGFKVSVVAVSYSTRILRADTNIERIRHPTLVRLAVRKQSGSCTCAIIGVPWCLRQLSLFSIRLSTVLTNNSPQAKHAETGAPPPWHTYDGTLQTA